MSAVTASSARPAALNARPVHSRQPSLIRNHICAGIASSARPPAITAWTSESGASVIAATWKPQATVAIAKPIAHHLDANRARALASGCEKRTAGAWFAPLCLQRNAMFAPIAETSAKMIPSSTMPV